jgi:DNA (cytosine-5)-methyltransferase 1
MIVMEEMLTTKEVAQKLRLSVETVKKMLREGILPGHKVGRKWLVSSEELTQYLAKQRNTP